MRKLVFLITLFMVCFCANAQELNCSIIVNSDQVSQTNQQIFKTLERSLNDFVNKNKWTNRVYKENERVNAQIFITITDYESDRFKGNIQIQSSRPVYNTSYESPVFNYKDNQFNFQYIEFQPLVFNENVFESNLVGVVSYYIYIMLGLDADTFSLEGGTDMFRKAQGKQVVAGTMKLFETMIKRRPNAFLIQTFFDAKAEEIQNIFSDGPKVDIVKLKETLNKIAPLYSSTWNDIKY